MVTPVSKQVKKVHKQKQAEQAAATKLQAKFRGHRIKQHYNHYTQAVNIAKKVTPLYTAYKKR